MRLTVSFEWLSGCSGCEVGTVDLHERLLAVLDAIDIVRLPILMDERRYPKADLGIVTGALRTEHDVQALHALRNSCTALLAFGICAVYGGPQGAGDAHTLAEICDTVYTNGPTTATRFVPFQSVPGLLEGGVSPVDSEVEVDFYLPGCPPHPYYIAQALTALVSKGTPEFGVHNVCFRCTRRMTRSTVGELRRFHEITADPDTCWLSQGVLCMGSATLDRCLAPCPQRGVPCTGCAGPSEHVLLEPNRDIRTEIAERMSRMTAIANSDIIAEIERRAKTYYAYAMASPVFRDKPTFLFKRWMTRRGGASWVG
jgi:F420-non-reducing hydrogenase small subunit